MSSSLTNVDPPLWARSLWGTPSACLSDDDQNLFNNHDRCLGEEIDEKEFRDRYCNRLLFTWEWVYHFCFGNYPLTLQTWYQILENEDVWLWVDGDEEYGSEAHLDRSDLNYRTTLNPRPHPSRLDLQKGVEILRSTLRNKRTKNSERDTQSGWRQRLEQCPNPHVRYLAVACRIAASGPIRMLDSRRRIKGRSITDIYVRLGIGPAQKEPDLFNIRWAAYTQHLKDIGHTCTGTLYPYPVDNNPTYGMRLILEFLEVISPGYRLDSSMLQHWRDSCTECDQQREFLVSDLPWGTNYQEIHNISPPSDIVPSYLLRFLWCLWFSGASLKRRQADVGEWLHWLELLVQHADPISVSNKRVYSILCHLSSLQMDEWIQPNGFPCHVDQSCFHEGEVIGGNWMVNLLMYQPTEDEWKAAEGILSNIKAPREGRPMLNDVCATLGVLAYWIFIKGVTLDIPDIYLFRDIVERNLAWGLPRVPLQEDSVPLHVKRRIMADRSDCCEEVSDRILNWYLASASLLVCDRDITQETVWRCRCPSKYKHDLTTWLNNRLAGVEEGVEADELEEICDVLTHVASKIDFDVSFSLKPKITSNSGETSEEQEERTSSKSSIGDDEDEDTIVIKPLKARMISRSAQIEAIRTHILNNLKNLGSKTRSIPSLSLGGRRKEALPWKTLPQILEERGHEFENWPAEVPIPGNGSELVDDNKGIHGLNAKHLRALYEATQDIEKPLRFRRVREMVSVDCLLRGRERRGEVRERESSDEGEGGPSKRRRTDVNTSGPSRRQS